MAKQAFDGKRLSGWWLPPEAPTSPDEPGLRIIGLDTDDGKEHPLYDEKIHRKLDEKLVQNIDKYGIHTPIKVRKNGPYADVVFGRTRVRAAREVNRRRRERGDPELKVPCTKIEGEEKYQMAVSFSENSARRQTEPLDQARDMARYAAQGADEDDIAITFAVSKQTVVKRLALLSLSPKVISAIESQQIAPSTALTLKSMTHEDQAAKLKELKAAAPSSNGKSKRPTAKQAAAAAGRRVRPSNKQIKVMLESGALEEISASDYLRWHVGELSAAKVKGLTAALKAAGLEGAK